MVRVSTVKHLEKVGPLQKRNCRILFTSLPVYIELRSVKSDIADLRDMLQRNENRELVSVLPLHDFVSNEFISSDKDKCLFA